MIWPLALSALALYLYVRRDDSGRPDDLAAEPFRAYSPLGSGPDASAPAAAVPPPPPASPPPAGPVMSQSMTDARGGRWGFGARPMTDSVTGQTLHEWRARSVDYKPEKVIDGRAGSRASAENAAQTAIDSYADWVAEQAVLDAYKKAYGA